MSDPIHVNAQDLRAGDILTGSGTEILHVEVVLPGEKQVALEVRWKNGQTSCRKWGRYTKIWVRRADQTDVESDDDLRTWKERYGHCEDAPCCGCCGPQGDGDYYGYAAGEPYYDDQY